MITARAQAAVEPLLRQCAVAALAGSPERVSEFGPLPGLASIVGTHAVMLSISSHMFRMVVLLHHVRDSATRSHFATLHQRPAEDFDDQAFRDALSESGNMLCGQLNRELGRSVLQLGMSTPHVIARRSIDHLATLRHGYEKHWRLSLVDGPSFDLSVVLCDYGDVDFECAAPSEEQVDTAGELEFF
jgi:CheY-specific phosphatase CheX